MQKTNDLMRAFYAYIESMVEVPRVCHGEKSSIETLISEEAGLIASYLRGERKSWQPRVAITP